MTKKKIWQQSLVLFIRKFFKRVDEQIQDEPNNRNNNKTMYLLTLSIAVGMAEMTER